MEMLQLQIFLVLSIGFVTAINAEAYALSHELFGFWDSYERALLATARTYWNPHVVAHLRVWLMDVPGISTVALLIFLIRVFNGRNSWWITFSLLVSYPVASLLVNACRFGWSAFQAGFLLKYVLALCVLSCAWLIGRYLSLARVSEVQKSGATRQWLLIVRCILRMLFAPFYVLVSFQGWYQLYNSV
jgi:hypothetical protein